MSPINGVKVQIFQLSSTAYDVMLVSP